MGWPPHQQRRALNALEQQGKIRLVRANRCRLIRRVDVDKLRAELMRRGWLQAEATAAAVG
jgi:hypothetical protein